MDIGEIKPYPKNAKKHPDRQVEQIAASIKEFGFNQPIVVDKNNEIIVGHGRFLAAQKLGITEVPTIRLENLTEEQVKAYRLADNKLNESGWDMNQVIDELKALNESGFNIDLTGFEKDLILEIHEDGFNAKKEYESIIEPVTKIGDIYQLGRHRLICGDSTKRETFEHLLGADKVNLVFTDPPYNVGYDYWGFRGTRKEGVTSKVMFNDKKSPAEYEEFIRSVFQNCADFTYNDASAYCWHASRFGSEVRNGMQKAGYLISQTVIWLKNGIVFSPGQDYHRVYEPCFFGWKKGNKHFVQRKGTGDFKEFILLDKNSFQDWLDGLYEARDNANTYEHPTQKPVRLAVRAIRKHCPEEGGVLEPFGGSGSTLLAAEQMNRRAFVIELDPKYCDVIIKRWEKLTGKKAEKMV